MNDDAPSPRKRRVPKKMTQRRLRNIAMNYLKQRTTTRGHFRRLLMNRVRKSLFHHEGDESEMAGWVDALLDDLVRQNLINDLHWATARAARLRRKGMSERAIRSNLMVKAVPSDVITAVLDEGAPDPRAAAAKYAKRRGLGPFRAHYREAKPDKDLAKLVRAGFNYGIAREVLALDEDAALDLVYALR